MAAARRQGMQTMLEDGRNKILRGLTTPEEVIRAVYSATIE
jgi:type II secretory ATPase GspE/PulE/Tfp pilus assembly ATPase PilB-like protein